MTTDMAVVKPKLERFVQIRNASPHGSNLQFNLDLEEAGLDPDDLGEAFKLPDGSGHQWFIPEDGPGNLRLIEQSLKMRLETM